MKLPSFLPLASTALVCAFALFISPAARAQAVFEINVNTSALIGHPAGPFYLDFQLNDGAGVGNGNNTATLSGFSFGGGAPLGAATVFGNVTGNLASTITLRDTTPFNEFFQAFTAGSALRFTLTLSNQVSVPVPDLFSFAILDNDLFNLPTLAPGSDALFTVDIAGGTPIVNTYAGSSVFAPVAGGLPIALPAPAVVPVPEPSTYGLVGAALVGIVAWQRRRARISAKRATSEPAV